MMKKYTEDLEQVLLKFEDVQHQVHDPMEEVNLSTMEEPMITYVSSLLPSNLKGRIIVTPQEFKDHFTWSYNQMEKSLVKHRLSIKSCRDAKDSKEIQKEATKLL